MFGLFCRMFYVTSKTPSWQSFLEVVFLSLSLSAEEQIHIKEENFILLYEKSFLKKSFSKWHI